MKNKKTKRTKQYQENKSMPVGSLLTCPVCGEQFTKKQYSQVFCCSHCKDKYWNDKGDRHDPSYYEEYDNARPERKTRRELYGSQRVISIGGNLTPRQKDDIFGRILQKKIELEIYDLD
jgi:ribosomal protein L37AE/L43A